MFEPFNTADHTTAYCKTLLYAQHGWGKTTQAKYFQREYGPGFIISGESGLSSVRSAKIDYLPFSSWDGHHNHVDKVYSFKGLLRDFGSVYQQRGYKWLMIDSLTELADHAMKDAEAKAEEVAKQTGKPINGFAVWDDYGANMLAACKWARDLPLHVLVTALAKEGEDANGNKDHWPMVKGKQVQQQLPGIFDNVLCGVKRTQTDPAGGPDAEPKTIHYIVTDEYRGWHGKVRDEKRRLKPVERESDITKLLSRMAMPDSDYELWLNQQGGTKQ